MALERDLLGSRPSVP